MRFILYFILWRWFFSIVLRAQTDPVESLFVSIEGDFSNLLDAADEGVEKTKDKLEGLDEAGQKAGKGIKGGAAIAGAAFGLAATAASGLLTIVLNLAQAIPAMFQSLAQEGIAANKQFETSVTQFHTLLGSAEAAKERMDELAKFGVETPFELPEIIEANRTLQTFGGNLLASEENMRRIGDAAAGTAPSFQEVAFWTGRLYAALQGGQPFGEAAARLTEMSILTPPLRAEMERMAKAGEDGNKIFELFASSKGGLGKFTDNMERLSKTMEGIQSNLADFRGNLLRLSAEPFFLALEEAAQEFLETLNENEEELLKIGRTIGGIAALFVTGLKNLGGSFDLKAAIDKVSQFADWLERVVRSAVAFANEAKKQIELVAEMAKGFSFLSKILEVLTFGQRALFEIISRLDEAMVTAAQITALFTGAMAGLRAGLQPAFEALSFLGDAIKAVFAGDFDAARAAANNGLDAIKDGVFDVDEAVNALRDSVLKSAEDMKGILDPAEIIGDSGGDGDQPGPEDVGLPEPNAVLDMIDGLTNQMIAATERRDQELAKIESDHQAKMAKIAEEGQEKRLEIEEKFTEAAAKLAEDTEKERLKILDDSREELGKLRDNTDKQLKAKRKDFNREEMRDTEDHLRELRRLEEDFLFNLEDAVKDRDAGRIVDLQRRFEKESQQKEEDFSRDRSRTEEDFSVELDQIRQNESTRRQEILASQAKELEALRIHEEEKRAEIEQRRIEEIEKLEENLTEKLQQEQDNYIERQTALEQALQQQLAAIAKNLADEKDITEEGARQILQTFSDYFGVDGEIDQLMEDFAKRRRVRAEIRIDFESRSKPEQTQAQSSVPDMRDYRGGSTGFAQFAEGGTLMATKPTLAMFGEAGPEIVQFTPLADLVSGQGGQTDPQRFQLEFSGSAPPGIGRPEMDQIAGILVQALRDSGALTPT